MVAAGSLGGMMTVSGVVVYSCDIGLECQYGLVIVLQYFPVYVSSMAVMINDSRWCLGAIG